jgi:TetR/AcrR family transcriptional regulator, repressor of fatR-cypB operon
MNVRSINLDHVRAWLGPHLDGASHEILEYMNEVSKRKVAPPKRRGRPVVDDKRRRLLDAALKMFAERGYHGVAVPEVAAAAGVGTGTLYHYFANKQELVNELYRDAKFRLRSHLLDGLQDPDLDKLGAGEAWFFEIWRRLALYAREWPHAFRFLEMQDHVEYLDAESRQIELATLVPMFMVAKRVHDRVGGARVDVVIALMFGAFVGLVKAARLGYLQLDDVSLAEAGKTVWRMFEPETTAAAKKK